MTAPDPRFIDENGNIRSWREMNESQIRASHAAKAAKALADAETERQKPELQRRIEMYKSLVLEARKNGDKYRLPIYRDKLQILEDEWADQQAAQAKAARFAADRRIDLIRQSADALERSGSAIYTTASRIDIETLCAIARSESYPDPDSQYRDFQELAGRLDAAELEAERIKASDSEIASAQASAEHARSQVRMAELRQAQQAREIE